VKAKPNPVLILAASALIALTLLGGCSNSQETDAAQSGEMAGTTPPPAASQAQSLAPAPPGSLRGPVIETIDSGGYTYVCVETDGKQVWAAAPEFKVAVGDVATFSTAMPMANYKSTTLDRSFEMVYFAGAIELGGGRAAEGTSAGQSMPAGHPSIEAGNASGEIDLDDIKRADGGVTVAEVYAGKGALRGSEVVVRGKVVKYNASIMGYNWLHIQDGTGGADTNDLTVTTKGTVKVGQTVIVSGVLAADKDFGAGYRYEVIVEDATVTVQ
jgi:hypothetical protein